MIAFVLAALASILPAAPSPAAPFPKILTDAPVFSRIAPGVTYGDYSMTTLDGPLAVHVIAIDLHEPTVRVGTVLANDQLVSPGESVSAMAHRSGAVAGVNGDYFDINQTNQPLNILVQNGRLIRMPMQRWAIAFDGTKSASFAEFAVSAQATLPGGVLPLKTINDWPPPGGGAVLITADYGALHPAENITEFTLEPVNGSPPFATYRITGIADNTKKQPPGYYLALGLQAYGAIAPPNAGDTISVQGTATPPLESVANALGGGPLLVKDGAWFPDPDGPNKGEFLTHMPATAVGVTRDGTLLLFQVDGRQPASSIGVLQPQLASLMIAFGVVTGMQLDGGGSSTIVARLPGDTAAAVQNSPSDGIERPVGDSLLIYSDAPHGPPAQLTTMPQAVRTLPGGHVSLNVAITDAGGHALHACACTTQFRVIPSRAGSMHGNVFIASGKPQNAIIRVKSGTLMTDVPVHITTSVARAEILPRQPTVQPKAHMHLAVQAFDARGYPIAIPSALPWTANGASIDDRGDVTVSNDSATVSVRVGDKELREAITVGEHAQSISMRDLHFSSAPAGGPGGIEPASPCTTCTTLRYDFTGTERAAYVDGTVELPDRTLALSADVYGDGNGEVLRVALTNRFNERFLYTLGTVNFQGWHRLTLVLPAEVQRPITLKSLYVVNRVGPMQPVTAAGAISIRDIQVTLPGRAPNTPVQ